MRFTSFRAVSEDQAVAILTVLRRYDALAQLRVDSLNGTLRINGAITADQVANALRESGCESVLESEFEQDVGGCCGGCA